MRIWSCRPFAVVAPALGPLIDRSRGARRAMVVTSALGAYYYLRVLVYVYFREPEAGQELEPRSLAVDWGLGLACLGVALLGLGPGRVLELARRSAEQLFS